MAICRDYIRIVAPITILLVTSSLAVARPAGNPPPQLVVTSVLSDLAAAPCLLTLRGREFGEGTLEVRLADEELIVLGHDDTWALAELDCATEAGDHLLEVSRGPSATDRDVLSLTIGAVGPMGPAGPAGPPGLNGLAGVQIVSFVWPHDLDGGQALTFDCPAGQHVLSGGWRAQPGTLLDGNGFEVDESYPSGEGTWFFRMGSLPSIGGGSEFGEFFLVCAVVP